MKENNDTVSAIEQRMLCCLDDLLSNTIYSKPDFIKIDTQGYELEILKGGENPFKCKIGTLRGFFD